MTIPSLFMLYNFLITFPMMVKSLNDSEALLSLKQSLNNPQHLDSWTLGTRPCDDVPNIRPLQTQWVGLACTGGVVSSLHLRSMNLSGDIDVSALAQLQGLRILSLRNNSFSGPIPEFNRLGALKALYLSNNHFSGDIPQDYFSKMVSLKKIWFNANNFTGQIPSSIAQLPKLMELHLERNQFSGKIPSIGQQSLESLDLSNNNLTGEVPSSLARFDAISFEGNPGLCGARFGKVCEDVTKNPDIPERSLGGSEKIAYSIMVLCGFILGLMIIGIFVLMRREKQKPDTFEITEKDSPDGSIGLSISNISKKSNSSARKSMGSGRRGSINKAKGVGDLMLLNHGKGTFGLADLMKAAAEVLGNGVLGSSYKAIMSNGETVVVKRLKDMNKIDKDGFDAEMKRLGSLAHPNVLTPLACHYRKEEKLLVYEYIPKGSLLYLLHGDRGASHAELNWPTRLRIIKGIAQGLGYIHTELAILDLPHGDLKSCNVLLGPNNEPLLVDYGLINMIDTSQVANALAGYKAPEVAKGQPVSPKCDVYCLGVIILEILTGKFPSQYLNNGKGGTDVVQWVRSAISEGRERELFDPEIVAAGSMSSYVGEMEKLLHIGATCTESNPDERLDIREAIRRVEAIQVEASGDDRPYHMPSLRDGYADAAESQSNIPYLVEGVHPRNDNPGAEQQHIDSFAFRAS